MLNKDNLKHINDIVNLDHSLLYHGSQIVDMCGSMSSKYRDRDIDIDIDRDRDIDIDRVVPVKSVLKSNSTNSLYEVRDLDGDLDGDSFIQDYDNNNNMFNSNNDINNNNNNMFNSNEDDEVYEDLFIKNENSLIFNPKKTGKSSTKISSFRMNILSPLKSPNSSSINNNNNNNNCERVDEHTSLLHPNNNNNK
jgi:hypothetical protein